MRVALFTFLTCGAILVISSCQKEINWDDYPPGGNFKAKINGTQWYANKTANATRFGGFISLLGISTDKKMVVITLTDSGVHRYTLNQNTLNIGLFVDSNSTDTSPFTTNQGTIVQSGGEVNITSIDTTNKKMSGTFNYKVYRIADDSIINFTEGSFTNLAYASGVPPAGSKPDTFQVKISGVLWVPPVILSTVPPAPYNNNLAVSGLDMTTSKSVALSIPPDITPGNYNFSVFGPYYGVYKVDNDPNNLKVATLGTLTILEHQPAIRRIRGNFNFTASDILNPLNFVLLTEGYFSVTYY